MLREKCNNNNNNMVEIELCEAGNSSVNVRMCVKIIIKSQSNIGANREKYISDTRIKAAETRPTIN